MSNIYIQEPPTNGKVLLVTSVGDIDIELWGKETPKACRNFIQLCLEGYYDNTIFHRIVKGFCIQGGDPTGTGLGGENIYGQSGFKDEFHQRLKFNRRGLVAMANSGPNDNRSQFFFTLDRTDELNGKHTIFGKVTGNTIYNMIKMADMEVDDNDHPLYPPKVIRTEVLSNPFDDIEPRQNQRKPEKKANHEKKPKVKGTKNFSLLSFGEEAEDDEEEVKTVSKKMKMASSHDILDDPLLSKEAAVPQESQPVKEKERNRKNSSSGDDDSDDEKQEEKFDQKMRDKVRNKLKKSTNLAEDASQASGSSDKTHRLREESRRLQKELVGAKRKRVDAENQTEKKEDERKNKSGVLAEFHAEQQNYLNKKSAIKAKGGGRDDQTFSLLEDFQAKLLQAEEEEETETVKAEDVQQQEDDDTGWLSHALKCETHGPNVKDANVQDEDTFEIFDPRNPINKRRREASKQSMKDRKSSKYSTDDQRYGGNHSTDDRRHGANNSTGDRRYSKHSTDDRRHDKHSTDDRRHGKHSSRDRERR
ncbi:spliceosome-associated protein CWC27 homolog isoform X2 [Nematostella vectensis]|uniref:spliceosome-associated protein CWC27 homolog isoform X2 n=1 Tax=Nematostella vectensis TaxID=45351 RepID=UPI0020772C83|nr:spliceosome-associated protein CWC27 homolog isoform X2 [Nematostella vectensis]